MIRLLAALGVFLFMAMWFLGEDHGQFINPPRARAAAVTVSTAARPVFIPAQRVMQAEPVAAVVAQAPALTEVAVQPAQPEQQLAAIKVMHVPGGASVRAGPGREFGVIGDLSGGDVVMVIDDTSAPGWVRIRVDGRGEGWVAAKLLRE
jgi:hypothetical protein